MTEIFVFGSNLAGRHGKGAAKEAVVKHGAKYGVAIGPKGNSYAIPTKDGRLKTLPLNEIRVFVDQFIAWANGHPDQTFNVTRVGCGLAGYTDADIAPMFRDAPANCKMDPAWERIINGSAGPKFTLFIDGAPNEATHRPYRNIRTDETPNDYWDHLVKEAGKVLTYDLCNLAIMRRAQGYTRHMPAHLAVPFVQFPSVVEMRVSISTTIMEPEEYATFTWRVPDRVHGARISVSRGDWVPDVNDWQLLARFFHKNYAQGVLHEVDELFKFGDQRIFDPHVIAQSDLSSIDGKTQYLHHEALMRRQRIHDFSGK